MSGQIDLVGELTPDREFLVARLAEAEGLMRVTAGPGGATTAWAGISVAGIVATLRQAAIAHYPSTSVRHFASCQHCDSRPGSNASWPCPFVASVLNWYAGHIDFDPLWQHPNPAAAQSGALALALCMSYGGAVAAPGDTVTTRTLAWLVGSLYRAEGGAEFIGATEVHRDETVTPGHVKARDYPGSCWAITWRRGAQPRFSGALVEDAGR